jgi:2-octaprenyl-6-methoxyphenol hydroxylase
MRIDEDASEVTAATVVGGGPAGLLAALALAHFGVSTRLIARRGSGRDNRTTALIGTSVAVLESLGVWDLCRTAAAPLRTLRIIDDTDRLWRAPQVQFEAREIGREAFGWNIENVLLIEALWQRLDATPAVIHIDQEARRIEPQPDAVTVTLADGSTLRSLLVVGADGRNSLCRAAAGINLASHAYRQTALTFVLSHARPHHDISTEFHTRHGPFTLVPLPGLRSSLVWVTSPDEATRISALQGTELDEEIERRSHSILGRIRVQDGGGSFAMAVANAARFAANRIVLVGEAAHLFPPIGAQGLNLGLRDAATIGDIAGDFHRRGEDPGGVAAMTAYDRRRRGDITTRTLGVELLNRSLLSDFLPVQAVRALGLHLLDQIGPLRRAVMREGVAPRAGALEFAERENRTD